MKDPTLRWLVLGGAVVASAALGFAALRHGIAEHRAGSSSPDQWLLAAEKEPSNPENWYRLGRYRQLDFEHVDMTQAISYYQRAVAINPASPYYWTDLADAYDTAGNPVQAEKSFRAAQEASPISPDVAWRFGNFLLRQNRTDEAFQQIRRAVAVNPELTAQAVSLCWRSTQDVDRILSSALPAKPEAYWGALDYFVNAREPDAAMAAWKRVAATGTVPSLAKTFPALDMFIESGHADEAKIVWQQALAMAKIDPEYAPPESLIWNGGFENDLLNGGFAWRFQPVDGAKVDFDGQTAHSGNRSLRIVFDGTTNVSLENMWQYVVVEPNKHYRFTSYIRTENLTTDGGIRFEIRDVTQPTNAPQFTGNAVGTQPWGGTEVDFSTGPITRILRVILQRTPTAKLFDNKIRGTVWLDDVALIPAPPVGAARP